MPTAPAEAEQGPPDSAMDHFLALLSGWRGRPFVQRELEVRGFAIPTKYQERVAAKCSLEARSGLDVYWDETAREYMCSAGQVNSATRSFPEWPCYRSKYLDHLASMRGPSALFKVTPLHPCLHELAIERRSNPDFDPTLIRTLEAAKQAEIRDHGIRAEQWTGQKNEAGQIFAALMEEKGFKKWRTSYVKKATSGLVFGGFADTGGRPYCITVPFHFFIAEDSDMVELFQFSFEMIAPGFWHYYRFGSIESAVLGFRAHVEMIDIVSESFDSVS